MANFHYIIAGLPDLVLDYEASGYDFESLYSHISSMSSPKERRCMQWLMFGLREENLNNHFYRASLKSPVKFIREYFTADLEIRNIQVAVVARKNSLDPTPYIIGNNEFSEQLRTSRANDFGVANISENAAELLKIMEIGNILDREQQLDLYRWQKANEICTFNYFDINVILSFLLKASIVKRWNMLDKKRGAVIFKQFVDEVKGSFKMEKNY
ncbi:MAG: DUF2764 family protein [Bacteroidales bacterium]|jgi:hypothetical protein|nr:DUF2764 family protein [Bacteroidales bacterium]